MHLQLFVLLFLLTGFQLKSSAQITPQIDSIPMRDGEFLAADVYIPNQCNTCPVIVVQTPYNRQLYRTIGLPLGIGMDVDNQDYIWVIVDWRGFYGSLGALTTNPDRGEDGYDVMDWVANQSWSDGNIGTWGPSALGRVQYLTAQQQHPNHKCAVPLVAAPQYTFEGYYPGGVYRTEFLQQLDGLGFGLSGFVLQHPTRDVTWQFVENDTYFPGDITVPMCMIGGWYDHNVDAMIDFFAGIQSQSDINVRDRHRLVMGPWAHGGSGTAQVGTAQQGELNFPAAAGWSDSLALAFFDFHLRNINNNWDNTPKVQSFQMGEDVWEGYSSWPPGGTTPVRFYLNSNNVLSTGSPLATMDFSPLIYDPADPSPTVGGPTLLLSLDQGPYDQAPVVETRQDVVLFTSAPLNAPVDFRGSPKLVLHVASDQLDTDFAVRLTDVYPDGRSMLLSDGIRRMRFRNGFTPNDTANMVPGTVYEIEVQLPHQAHTFLSGHRIRIDISSSNYPRFDNNLNNGQAMYTAGDTLVAHNVVHHSSTLASYLELPLPQSFGLNDQMLSDIQISPNPAADFIDVSYGKILADCEIVLHDITGKEVYRHQTKNSTAHRIDLSGFKKGMYVLTVTGDQQSHSEKIVIQ